MSSPPHLEEVSVAAQNRTQRNVYFPGKLMTSDDMAVEQAYHRDRLHAITRYVLGAGLVCGLSTTIEEDGEHLYGVVQSGVALDHQGRSIVVSNPREKRRVVESEHDDSNGERETLPRGDEIYVSLRYAECGTDSVPVADFTTGCEERCCYNRVVEQFTLHYTESPPAASKRLPTIIHHSDDDDDDDDSLDPLELARRYYESEVDDCAPHEPFPLLLGRYTRDDGEWTVASDSMRPMVYTNDMLYGLIDEHVRDHDNPHRVQFDGLRSVHDVSGDGENVQFCSDDETIDITATDSDPQMVNFDVTERVARSSDLDALEEKFKEEIEALNGQIDTLNTHVVAMRQCLRAMKEVMESHVDDDISLGKLCERFLSLDVEPDYQKPTQMREELYQMRQQLIDEDESS